MAFDASAWRRVLLAVCSVSEKVDQNSSAGAGSRRQASALTSASHGSPNGIGWNPDPSFQGQLGQSGGTAAGTAGRQSL